MNPRELYRKVKSKYLQRFNKLKYIKLVGVNISKRNEEESVFLFGKIDWGTEPWLISLGYNVYITDGVKFLTHDGGTLLFRDEIFDLEITKPIKIGDNVYIGNNAIILPGVKVGNNVIIGAGAVVTKDIPENSVVGGVPAIVIKNLDDYLSKVKNESIHLGHLKGKEKDLALKKYYGYKGSSKGIYF